MTKANALPTTAHAPGRPVRRPGIDTDMEMKRVNFQLKPELHTKLKIVAARQGKSITQLLTEYVESLPNL